MEKDTSSPETSSGTAKEANSSTYSPTELVTVTQIETTPFSAVQVGDKYFLALGSYRLTDLKDSLQEILDYLEQNLWNVLIQVINILLKELLKIKEQETKPQDTTPTTN